MNELRKRFKEECAEELKTSNEQMKQAITILIVFILGLLSAYLFISGTNTPETKESALNRTLDSLNAKLDSAMAGAYDTLFIINTEPMPKVTNRFYNYYGTTDTTQPTIIIDSSQIVAANECRVLLEARTIEAFYFSQKYAACSTAVDICFDDLQKVQTGDPLKEDVMEVLIGVGMGIIATLVLM
jgi:hypothetical protein